jgi:hypothetical protein
MLLHAVATPEGTNQNGRKQGKTDIASFCQDAKKATVYRTSSTVFSIGQIILIIGGVIGIVPNA